MQYLAIKNWDKFQLKLQNGKRNLDWIRIKTHRTDDSSYASLSLIQRGLLIGLMEYSGRSGRWAENNVTFVAQATDTIPRDRPHLGQAIATLVSRGFLILCNQQKIEEFALEEKERRGEESNPPTPHTSSDQGRKETETDTGWKSYFKTEFGKRPIKDRPETWSKLADLKGTYGLSDIIGAFRRFLAGGYVGDYPLAAFLPVAESLLQAGEAALVSAASGPADGPAKPAEPALADELAEISKLDIVFGSSQRLALTALEREFGRPDMVLAFKAFMGNLQDEKDYKFAAKNFVEQARSYVYVIRKDREEAAKFKAQLEADERQGEKDREEMERRLAAEEAQANAEENDLLKDMGVR